MKRKFLSVLFALVLVLSFSLVTAVPAVGQESSTYVALEFGTPRAGDTATWETDKNTAGITGYDEALGSYSAKLTKVNAVTDGPVYVEFVPEPGITMADLATIGTTSFWYYFPTSGSNCGPQLELLFTIPEGYVPPATGDLYDPSDGAGFAVVWLMPLHSEIESEIELVTDNWTELVVETDTVCAFYKVLTPGGVETYYEPEILTLANTLQAIDGHSNMSAEEASAADWELVRVRVELWEPRGPVWSSYIDNITIDGTLYELEPRVINTDTSEGFNTIQDAIDDADTVDGHTISVAAGTYSAETSWPIDISKKLTVQSVADAATTIITPGAAGQGVIAITSIDVTIDDFTITHGTQSSSASNPKEHTVWVADEYSTIKNNTIIGAGGNQAGLFIGGRTEKTDGTAQWWYDVSKPLGHIIQDNTFRYAHAGEGWSIFAVDLSDSLIKGNTFAGDAADVDNWVEGNEGASGTGIVIHNATFATADGTTGSPGGGYVVIENNTAQYIKYVWLNFTASFMYADVDGVGYEKADAGTINGVIVRNNTVSDIGQDAVHDYGRAVNFQAEKKDYPSGTPLGASLTIGSNKVTIGPGNDFHDVDTGVYIKDPKVVGGSSYYGILNAANIVIKYNDFADAESYGVYNGMYYDGLAAAMLDILGDFTIPARFNYWDDPSGPTVATATSSPTITVNDRGTGETLNTYITYIPWLHTEAATVVASNTRYYAFNFSDLKQGWNIWSTPIALDEQAATWGNYKALGVDLDLTDIADGPNAYYFNGSEQSWAQPGDDYALKPCDAIYIKMASAQRSPILFSPEVWAPDKTLYAGWNLVGPSYFVDVDAPTAGDLQTCDIALTTAYTVTGDLTGWDLVVSPPVNRKVLLNGDPVVWSYSRAEYVFSGPTPGNGDAMYITFGYWVHMVNGGTMAGGVFTPISPLLP